LARSVGQHLEFTIESKGDEAVARLLHGLAHDAADPRPAFRQIAEELAIGEGAWFASDGAGTWPALAEATIREKQQKGYPPETLVATGKLKRSLIVRSGSSSRRTITARGMRYGTRVPYAIYHQRARTGYSKLPSRPPMLPVSRPTRRRMVRDVRDYLMRNVGHSESLL
jgi:hypothetical protein